MKRFFILAALFLSSVCGQDAFTLTGVSRAYGGAPPSLTYLQDVVHDNCTNSSTTCTVALQFSNAAGSTIMLDMGSKGWTGSPVTISSVWMCNTNPCTSNTEGSTWVTGLAGYPQSIPSGSPTHGVDIAYTLKSNGGATFMTVTRSAGTVTFWGITISEVLCSNCGTISVDAIGTAGASNSCTSCSGASFSSLSGSNDFVMQALDIDQTPSAASSPYILTGSAQWMYYLENNATAAPTFTQTPAGQSIVPALAFKSTVAPNSPVYAFGQEALSSSCAAGTTCSVTTAATTSGSILYCLTFTSDATQRALSSCSQNSGGGTFTACGAGCQSHTAGDWTDMGIVLGGTGGGTTFTCTMSTSVTNANWICSVLEIKCNKNCGTLALDKVGTAGSSASCSSCLGPTYSGLTGTSDATAGGVLFANSTSGLPTTAMFLTSDGVWLYGLNTLQTAAATVTQSPAGASFIPGVAIK